MCDESRYSIGDKFDGENKKGGYGWLSRPFIWIRILETRAFTSSIHNSLTIAVIGLVWAVSMICFVQGLLSLKAAPKQ